MTAVPSIAAQIATLLRITARLEAGGVVMAYPEELPSLSAVLVTLQQHERLEAALRLAHKELKAIARLGGFKKSCGLVVSRIEGMVPELAALDAAET